LVEEGLVSEKNSFVIGKGSITGVDITRFNDRPSVRDKIRSDMNSEDKLIILYLGRLKKDKGILDLVEAFKILRNKSLKIDLWIVGPDEENLTPIISSVVGIKQISYTSEPEAYMTSADIFCLPSYREGFGNVIIESAACGVPSVVNEIYGLTDSVVKNKTGLFAKTRSVESLADTLEVLITDDSLRSELGRNAQKRARKDFSQKAHNDLQIDLYNKLQYEHFKGVN
jgi:glycosyltransferase involved in cell wall biosynthesis